MGRTTGIAGMLAHGATIGIGRTAGASGSRTTGIDGRKSGCACQDGMPGSG